MRQNPLNAYRQTTVKTAGQGRLIVMLYDELLKQLDLARDELTKKGRKLDKAHNHIVKAQEVLTELMASLDFEKGGDIAANLYSLYMFFNQQLMEANMEKNPETLGEVRNLLKELRDAWSAIEGQASVGKSAVGVNIAG